MDSRGQTRIGVRSFTLELSSCELGGRSMIEEPEGRAMTAQDAARRRRRSPGYVFFTQRYAFGLDTLWD